MKLGYPTLWHSSLKCTVGEGTSLPFKSTRFVNTHQESVARSLDFKVHYPDFSGQGRIYIKRILEINSLVLSTIETRHILTQVSEVTNALGQLRLRHLSQNGRDDNERETRREFDRHNSWLKCAVCRKTLPPRCYSCFDPT